MIILDGRKTSDRISIKLKKITEKIRLKLAILSINDNVSSEVYVRMKRKKCEELNIGCDVYNLQNPTQAEVMSLINNLNNDDSVTGILVQLPLPTYLNTRKILDSVDVSKDVDGLNSYHLMKILLNEEEIIPCTPKGIFRLLDEYGISVEGKSVCVIGFSDVVGKPLSTMCINRGATVTVCHIKTTDLNKHTLNSDIIMTATGVPNLITPDMIKAGSIVIDIGVTRINDKVLGDVDFEAVKYKCSFITPVPGGVGQMTVISLIENLILLAESKFNNKIIAECKEKKSIFMFMSRSDEPNTKNVITKLLLMNKKVIVPVCSGDEMLLSEVYDLEDMTNSSLNVPEPRIINPFNKDDIDIYFVPGKYFDNKGNRQGRGKGYFDRFLVDVKNKKPIIGLCFSSQVKDNLVVEKHDIPMDKLIMLGA